MNGYVLQALQVSKQYGRHTALERVDLSIRQGSIYGFIGQNGAGKSTLMRIAAGLVRPSAGRIELFGFGEGAGLVKARRRIGVTIEAPALFPHLNAQENLEVFRLQMGLKEKEIIRQTLSIVGLEDTKGKTVSGFSLGMKQRLGLAAALLGSPELLILDEPTNGLDPVGVVELRELLLRLNREHGISILISSHILSELHLLATDYGIIHQGRMLEQLTARELQSKCRQYLHIEADSPVQALEVLQKDWPGLECQLGTDGILRLYGIADKPGAVSRSLYEAGLEVRQLITKGDELEKYYTRLIGEVAVSG